MPDKKIPARNSPSGETIRSAIQTTRHGNTEAKAIYSGEPALYPTWVRGSVCR